MSKNTNATKTFPSKVTQAFLNFFMALGKNKNPLETITGLLILFITGYFLIWSMLVTKTNNINGYKIFTNFASIGGLNRGADVSINGVKIGSVTETKLNPNDFTVDVMMSIDNNYKFPTDTRAKITTNEIIGDKYIKLVIGNNSETLKENEKIKSEPFKPLEEIIGDLIFKEKTK